MELDVFDIWGDKVSFAEVNSGLLCVPEKAAILRDVVNWQMAKRRQGNRCTKGISDISGTTAKPYRQKRTGRARHGSLRSPQFRGGAVIFGPVVRDHSYSLNKKVRRLALRMALSVKVSAKKFIILDDQCSDNVSNSILKTKDAVSCLSRWGFGSSVLFFGEYESRFALAFRNISGVDFLKTAGANVYDILRHEYVFATLSSVRVLESRLL